MLPVGGGGGDITAPSPPLSLCPVVEAPGPSEGVGVGVGGWHGD